MLLRNLHITHQPMLLSGSILHIQRFVFLFNPVISSPLCAPPDFASDMSKSHSSCFLVTQVYRPRTVLDDALAEVKMQ